MQSLVTSLITSERGSCLEPFSKSSAATDDTPKEENDNAGDTDEGNVGEYRGGDEMDEYVLPGDTLETSSESEIKNILGKRLEYCNKENGVLCVGLYSYGNIKMLVV